jgi:hypothetical protein
MTEFEFDVFISHASEDKEEVAKPLANMLAGHHLRSWLDDSELKPGQSLRAKIDEGLRSSRFGLVVISRRYLAKPWTRAELGGLFAREIETSKVLVPVWHGVEATEVAALSPLLADRVALRTADGLQVVANRVAEMVREEVPSYRPGVPIYTGPLTRKILQQLPEGAYLLSNLFNSDGTPRISQLVPDAQDREAFWKHLRLLGLSRTRFYVYSSAKEFRAHMSARSIWSR